MRAAIAQWICLRQPSCGPGFKSQAFYIYAFHLQSDFVLYLSLFWDKDDSKQKEARVGICKKVIKLYLTEKSANSFIFENYFFYFLQQLQVGPLRQQDHIVLSCPRTNKNCVYSVEYNILWIIYYSSC